MKHALIFYAVAAVIIGAFAASMKQVSAKICGKPIRPARVAVFILAGLLWPWTFFQLVVPKREVTDGQK